jgi:multicomponent K+:H+ antiporter subunit E
MKRGRGEISPVLVLGMTGLWLLLNQTLAPAHLVLGLLLSIVLARFTSVLRPWRPRLRRLDSALLLLLVVTRDIVQSNFHVARIVLGLQRRQIRSGFVQIPLELRDPHGLAALSTIVTATPGTVWAGMTADGATLTLHVLDLQDEAAVIREIKQRYEQPLMRIFE